MNSSTWVGDMVVVGRSPAQTQEEKTGKRAYNIISLTIACSQLNTVNVRTYTYYVPYSTS